MHIFLAGLLSVNYYFTLGVRGQGEGAGGATAPLKFGEDQIRQIAQVQLGKINF